MKILRVMFDLMCIVILLFTPMFLIEALDLYTSMRVIHKELKEQDIK